MNKEQKERLISETKELIYKLNELNAFMATKDFYELPRSDKNLLYEQNIHMTNYIRVLGLRLELHGIKLYEKEEEKK